jgi:uncharacterized protein YdeI (YjbR/CyaY-like superfamily)
MGSSLVYFKQKKIALIHGFKEYCALLFMKGALLQNAEGILYQQTENVQSGRQIQFKNLQEIQELTPIIKAYIFEAIEVEKAGLKVAMKTTEDFPIPEEFQRVLDENDIVNQFFKALTPGRKKPIYCILRLLNNRKQELLELKVLFREY